MILKIKWTVWIILGFVAMWTILASCNKQPIIFDQTQSFPDNTWSYQDSIVYSFTIKDTVSRFDISLDISHEAAYDFQNVYTRIHTIYPDGNRVTQVLTLDLADNSGKWYGDKALLSDSYTTSFLMQKNIYFPQIGTYKLVVEQYSRNNPLQGIKAVRLFIEKAVKEK